MFKHVQIRTQLLIMHIFDVSHKTSMPIDLIAARRQTHWTKAYAGGLFNVRQNDIRANDISGKRRSAERWSVKMTFGWTTIRENDVRLNNDSKKCRSTLWSFANWTIRSHVDSVKWLSAIFCFCKTTIRWNDVSGNDVRHDEVSVIPQFGYMWRSSQITFGDVFFFGETTIRKNVSAKQQFGGMTFRESDVVGPISRWTRIFRKKFQNWENFFKFFNFISVEFIGKNTLKINALSLSLSCIYDYL